MRLGDDRAPVRFAYHVIRIIYLCTVPNRGIQIAWTQKSSGSCELRMRKIVTTTYTAESGKRRSRGHIAELTLPLVGATTRLFSSRPRLAELIVVVSIVSIILLRSSG